MSDKYAGNDDPPGTPAPYPDFDEGVQPAPAAAQASIEEMAQRLAPLRGITGGKSAGPPLALKGRANFRSVNDDLENAIKRLIELEAKVNALRGALVGANMPAENRPLPKPPADEGSIFEQLQHRVQVLNQLLGSISESTDISKDAVS